MGQLHVQRRILYSGDRHKEVRRLATLNAIFLKLPNCAILLFFASILRHQVDVNGLILQNDDCDTWNSVSCYNHPHPCVKVAVNTS